MVNITSPPKKRKHKLKMTKDNPVAVEFMKKPAFNLFACDLSLRRPGFAILHYEKHRRQASRCSSIPSKVTGHGVVAGSATMLPTAL